MSTAVKSPNPEPAHHYIVRRTVEACHMAKEAAGAAAEGIATGSSALLSSLRQRERELDTLDLEIDNGVTSAITEVAPAEARELLACMKFMIGLERIGDLLVIFRTQSLERAGDHAKNLAEEVCHFVSGRPVRHVLIAYDKPVEQMFIDYLRRRDHKT